MPYPFRQHHDIHKPRWNLTVSESLKFLSRPRFNEIGSEECLEHSAHSETIAYVNEKKNSELPDVWCIRSRDAHSNSPRVVQAIRQGLECPGMLDRAVPPFSQTPPQYSS